MNPPTERQLQVARLIYLEGMTMEEASKELGITARAVKAHCDLLRAKLGVQKIRQVGPLLRERGLI